MAIIYGGLNDKGQAFAWLDKVFDARSGNITVTTSRRGYRQSAGRPALQSDVEVDESTGVNSTADD